MLFIHDEMKAVCNMEILLDEIHILATHYHWSREECWNCPMIERKMWRDKVLKHYRDIESQSK